MRTPDPIHATDAEAEVLAACLTRPETVPAVRALLPTPESFYDGAHAAIYAAVLALTDGGHPVDIVTVTQQLRAHPGPVKVSASAVAELATGLGMNAEFHAGVVAEKAMLRAISRKGLELHRAAHEPAADPFDCLDAVQAAYAGLSGNLPSRALVPASAFIHEALTAMMDEHEAGVAPGVPMGFRALDEIIGGVRPGELVILAARPSMGKSALAGNILRNVAATGAGAAFFSMEMSAKLIGQRLLAAEARVPFGHIRNATIRDSDWPKFTQAGGVLSGFPMHIDATPALSPADIRSKLHKLRAETGSVPALVVVDYLGLMRGEGDNRVQQVGFCSRQMKAIAGEYQTGVLLLAQLSRGVEQRHPPRPVLSDLRDSGEVEQDADAVVFLWRPERYGYNEYETVPFGPLRPMAGMAEAVVEKQRNGALGSVWLRFDGDYLRFSDWHPSAPSDAEYATDRQPMPGRAGSLVHERSFVPPGAPAGDDNAF